jgi:outer membrane protein OmpA-like peptidoglycan-associated protein
VKANAVDFAIQFQVGSARVSPASEATLGSIAKILAMAPDRCVLVEGHTDATGNFDKNMALSRDRAGSVVNYIAEKAGIERNRLVPQGKGSTDPAPGLDPRDPKNRRVVFKVVAG